MIGQMLQNEAAADHTVLDDNPLYFFESDTAGLSFEMDKQLKIRDLVSAAPGTTVQLKHPVCIDCFETIIKGLDGHIKELEKERDNLALVEIMKLEVKLAKIQSSDESQLEAELRVLEAEEVELDRELQRLEEDEKKIDFEVKQLVTQKVSLS